MAMAVTVLLGVVKHTVELCKCSGCLNTELPVALLYELQFGVESVQTCNDWVRWGAGSRAPLVVFQAMISAMVWALLSLSAACSQYCWSSVSMRMNWLGVKLLCSMNSGE